MSRSCEESTDTPGGQNSQLILTAAKDEISEGFKPDTPLAGTCVAVLPSDLTFTGPQKDVILNQKTETDTQTENKLMDTRGERGGRDKLGVWD